MAAPHAQLIPSQHTFLLYDDPVEMEPDEPDPPPEKSMEYLKFWLFRTSDMRFIPDPRLTEYVSEYKKCKRKEIPAPKDTKVFLESLFPTKYWTDNGVRFKQHVSTQHSTRPMLINTFKKLESEMSRRQASKVNPKTPGYCPIRFSLHQELFDELIRQVTLECRFRGYMLNRVRGELYETLDGYKAILNTSLAEDSRTDSIDQDDPEILSLRAKVNALESELLITEKNRFNVGCDYKDICDKLDYLDQVRTQLYEPELKFTRRIQSAIESQLYHFQNPPSFEEEELEDVINI